MESSFLIRLWIDISYIDLNINLETLFAYFHNNSIVQKKSLLPCPSIVTNILEIWIVYLWWCYKNRVEIVNFTYITFCKLLKNIPSLRSSSFCIGLESFKQFTWKKNIIFYFVFKPLMRLTQSTKTLSHTVLSIVNIIIRYIKL